jgi:hypothetical protein
MSKSMVPPAIETLTAKMSEVTAKGRRPKHGAKWGKWRYDAKVLTLTHEGMDYEIDLEECGTCAEVLDWIFQIAGKARPPWTRDDIVDLIDALNDILDPQATLCGSGKDQGRLDVAKRLRKATP